MAATLMICPTCQASLRRQYINCNGEGCRTAISVWLCQCPRAILPSRCPTCLMTRLAELLDKILSDGGDDVIEIYGETFFGEAAALVEEAKDANDMTRR